VATGSKLTPNLLPGPVAGPISFEYTATNAAGETGTGRIDLLVCLPQRRKTAILR